MLDRQVEYLADAAEVLQAEGVRPGLHNHVGSLIETEYEIEYAMQQIGAAVLGASFDVGHLEWAGIPSAPFLEKYRDRLVDIHLKDLDLEIAAASRSKATPYYEVSDQRFFLEPGLGHIDLPNVLNALGDDFAGWIIIEVDRPSMEPFESAKVSWRWVEEHLPA
jgi:sugar phosphate isomerase/epimerase